MGVCKDITLFCDICNGRDVLAGSIMEARKQAKEDGWKKVKINNRWIDICDDCKNLELEYIKGKI